MNFFQNGDACFDQHQFLSNNISFSENFKKSQNFQKKHHFITKTKVLQKIFLKFKQYDISGKSNFSIED